MWIQILLSRDREEKNYPSSLKRASEMSQHVEREKQQQLVRNSRDNFAFIVSHDCQPSRSNVSFR